MHTARAAFLRAPTRAEGPEIFSCQGRGVREQHKLHAADAPAVDGHIQVHCAGRGGGGGVKGNGVGAGGAGLLACSCCHGCVLPLQAGQCVRSGHGRLAAFTLPAGCIHPWASRHLPPGQPSVRLLLLPPAGPLHLRTAPRRSRARLQAGGGGRAGEGGRVTCSTRPTPCHPKHPASAGRGACGTRSPGPAIALVHCDGVPWLQAMVAGQSHAAPGMALRHPPGPRLLGGSMGGPRLCCLSQHSWCLRSWQPPGWGQ
jgi:hypothetical protein